MLNRIKDFFEADEATKKETVVDTKLAAAALMAEAAVLDGERDEQEEAAMRRALTRSFELTEAECDSLMEVAQNRQEASIQMHTFTHAIKENCDEEERVEIMAALWEVVLADGVLHHYEDQLMRRVAGLIYVTDRDRARARQIAQERMDNQNT